MLMIKEWISFRDSEAPWAQSVSSRVCTEAIFDLEASYKRWHGDPENVRFRCLGRHNSARFSDGCRLQMNRVRLQKIGWVRVKNDTSHVDGRILHITLKHEAGRWFASLHCLVDAAPRERTDTDAVGVDLGLSVFATMSDGTVIDNPRHLNKHLKKIKHLSRQLSKKQKGSRNRQKALHRLAVAHRKVRNCRADFIHKLTTRLARTKRTIVVEGLAVKDMIQSGTRGMSRAIGDAGWSMFRSQLKYKTQWYGSTLIVADRYFPSTKRCSACGSMKNMELSDRVYECGCGLKINRDLNASLNLLSLATRESACGEHRYIGLDEAGSELARS